MLTLVFSLSLSAAAVSFAQNDKGSYGDDRMHAPEDVPVTPETLPLLKATEAGAVVLLSNDVRSYTPARVTVSGSILCSSTGLTKPDEMALPINSCSAMLITPTRVLTAAHCLSVVVERFEKDTGKRWSQADFSVILGHNQRLMVSALRPDGSMFISGAIRRVRNVLYCANTLDSDLAVLELDVREPEGPIPSVYNPVGWRKSLPATGEQLHLISSPRGLPIKLSSCAGQTYPCNPATVKRVDGSLFWATVDSHKGSSGGGVVDGNGKLFGVLSGGLPHERLITCVSNVRYSDDCPGDVLSRIDKLSADLFDDSKKIEPVNCNLGSLIDYPDKCENDELSDSPQAEGAEL